MVESHPAWVCGLKRKGVDEKWSNIKKSHPAWVCGLKHRKWRNIVCLKVTPCVGVWIETGGNDMIFDTIRVTPCVGVWIET